MANPISRTAYYTLAVRAADAERAKPILGDTFAQKFMNDGAKAVWEEFKSFTKPNAGNTARHAMIDDHLRPALVADPQATIIIIGAGFDARAFRHHGGHWVELDEPEILHYKESRLPSATAPNPLPRIVIEFARESLADKLAMITAPSGVHIIVEGVLMYLTREQRLTLLRMIAERFPRHTLYCDLMRKHFFETYSRDIHEKILGMGTTFTDMEEHPERLFTDNGYTMLDIASVPLYAAERANIGIPAFAIRHFMTTIRNGYVIAVFKRT
jgi:methyltransferase (TIGR00027 family)